MRTRKDMVEKIEDMMGRDGSREQAEQLFALMHKRKFIAFDRVVGFCLTKKGKKMSDDTFLRLWAECAEA